MAKTMRETGALRSRGRRRAAVAALGAAVVSIGVGLVNGAAANASRPPMTVHSGPAAVSSVSVNGSGYNYALDSQTGDVTVTGHYKIGNTGSNIDQIEIGWAGASTPLGCIYDGGGSAHGNFTFDLGAPSYNGSNEVIVNFAQNFQCETNAWWSSNSGPAVAEVAITPPAAASTGPLSVSKFRLDHSGTNSVAAPLTRSVVVSGSFVNHDTNGNIDQIQVGWEGSSAPVACLYDGVGPHHGTFNVNIGTPPSAGANYVVVHYAQADSCDTSGWWDGENTEPGAKEVGLEYAPALP